MIRVLLVDDHEFFRSSLVGLLDGDAEFQVVGECSDGSEVADAVAATGAEVVVMDVSMREMSGLEAAAVLQHEHAETRVVMLTTDTAGASLAAARASGAAGYLLKGESAERLLVALRRVAAGGSAWPEDLQDAGAPTR